MADININVEHENITKEINAMTLVPATKSEPAVEYDYPFVRLAQQTHDALIEATQRVVADAQSLLERNKAQAAEYLKGMMDRAKELQEQESRQNKFGAHTLDGWEIYRSANGGE